MKNKFYVFGMLVMVLALGLVLVGCKTTGNDGNEPDNGEYAFPKSISLSFSLPEKADERITKAQYDAAKGSGTELKEWTNKDGTNGGQFFSGGKRYWFYSGNSGEYGRMGYFEATKDQVAEIIQALSLPTGWTYRYEISKDTKLTSIFITPPGGTEGKASYYWLEPLNPMEYQYCDANGEWLPENGGFIQATTK